MHIFCSCIYWIFILLNYLPQNDGESEFSIDNEFGDMNDDEFIHNIIGDNQEHLDPLPEEIDPDVEGEDEDEEDDENDTMTRKHRVSIPK